MADAAEAPRPDAGAIRFLACVSDEVTRETVNRVVSHLDWAQAKVRAGNIGAVQRAIDPGAPPNLVLVDISNGDDSVAALEELMHVCPKTTRFLVIGSVNDVGLYRALMALGVVDYLVKPISGELLHDALTGALRDPDAQGAPGHQARLTVFLGTRGGVGTTTIAAATAWYFVHEFHQRAALIDLDLHFGNLALSLDLEPGHGLRDALEHPERIDGLLLASAMTSESDRLKVLASEETLDDTLHFQVEALGPVFGSLGEDFDQLVVDLPRALNDAARHLIAAADQFVLVTDLSITGLRDTLRLSELAKRLGRDKPLIAASQVGATHRGEVNQREFERGIGAEVNFLVSFDPKAAVAMSRQGKALPAVARKSNAAGEMLALAQSLSGREAVKKRSVLGRIWS